MYYCVSLFKSTNFDNDVEDDVFIRFVGKAFSRKMTRYININLCQDIYTFISFYTGIL